MNNKTFLQFLNNFVKTMQKYPTVDWNDAYSNGQLASKFWCLQELKKVNVDYKTIVICCGWIGTLANLFFTSSTKIKFLKIRSFDIDQQCEPIADSLNRFSVMKDWQFKAATLDIYNLQYDNFSYDVKRANGSIANVCDTFDTIINTSCEHLEWFASWYDKIPTGKILVLQNNNFFDIPTHVNCVGNLKEFEKQTPMSQVFYSGCLDLQESSGYQRFMRIGIK